MSATAGLIARFQRSILAADGVRPGETVVVAVSGGLDSCVLLHLVRFHAPEPLNVAAAHYDHALRPRSRDDAQWVCGLCRAWGLPFHSERAAHAPASESDARELRYDFLERVRRALPAHRILLGHHADDQAETVLFRILRGSGIEGLAAIPRAREPGLFRPLLDVWREELLAYAKSVRLRWREDASNAEVGFARNAIRHRLLPDAERLVAPGARAALVRLARLARANEEAWSRRITELLASIADEDAEGAFVVDRQAFLDLGDAVAARALRALARRFELSLDASTTDRALEFVQAGRSGTAIELGGGVELRRSLDRLALGRRAEAPEGEDRVVSIPGTGPGEGEAVLGGARVPVVWGGDGVSARAHRACFRLAPSRFPLQVRGRAPGDRMRTAGGTRPLKKVLVEARIPLERRARLPLLVDADGVVLWVPGVARATEAEPAEEGAVLLRIGVG